MTTICFYNLQVHPCDCFQQHWIYNYVYLYELHTCRCNIRCQGSCVIPGWLGQLIVYNEHVLWAWSKQDEISLWKLQLLAVVAKYITTKLTQELLKSNKNGKTSNWYVGGFQTWKSRLLVITKQSIIGIFFLHIQCILLWYTHYNDLVG